MTASLVASQQTFYYAEQTYPIPLIGLKYVYGSPLLKGAGSAFSLQIATGETTPSSNLYLPCEQDLCTLSKIELQQLSITWSPYREPGFNWALGGQRTEYTMSLAYVETSEIAKTTSQTFYSALIDIGYQIGGKGNEGLHFSLWGRGQYGDSAEALATYVAELGYGF